VTLEVNFLLNMTKETKPYLSNEESKSLKEKRGKKRRKRKTEK
jgi:hypothetical protein